MSFPSSPPTLTTERLTLRPLKTSDAEAIFAIYSHPEVMRYWSSPAMHELQEAHRFIERAAEYLAAQDSLTWGMTRHGEDKVIGVCVLHGYSVQNKRSEVGYVLGREYWGQGYMNEALVAMVDYAFGPCQLIRLEADLDPRNAASEKALARLGFVREGLLRERWVVDDEVSDSLMMGLLKREWHRAASNSQA